FLVAADIEELLVGRERNVARERLVGVVELLLEVAVLVERLHAAIFAVGNVDHALLGDAQCVRDVEVGWAVAARELFGPDDRAGGLAHRRLAERAPGALERAGVGVVDDDAVVAVAVSD